MVETLQLSIVIPSFNEERNVPLIFEEISQVLTALGYQTEFIFVNDGSADNTWVEIAKLCSKHAHVQGINFARNFGHAAALEAGLNAASGDAIIMMDADLQHPPALIPKLIEEWQKGSEVVNTVRLETAGVSKTKALSSQFFYRLINSISELELSSGEADFRLITRKVNDSLKRLPESPKFYRGLINWLGYPTTKVEYVAHARVHGKSSYSLKKMLELARLGITSFSKKPLKLIASVGGVITAVSLLALAAVVVVKFFINESFFSSLSMLVLFLALVTGILITFQGIVALYIVDIFQAAKGRPTFIIKEVLTGSRSEELGI